VKKWAGRVFQVVECLQAQGSDFNHSAAPSLKKEALLLILQNLNYQI
jgi:hypothetical protein